MRRREVFSGIKAAPPVMMRLDGRSFKEALARLGYGKPYDLAFERAMVSASRLLLEHSGLAPEWAFTFSDEINVYFNELPFDGRIEKLDSVVPSYVASALTIDLQIATPLAFDARVIPVHPGDAIAYLTGRQAEAWRNHMQSYGFYALVSEGMDEKDAATRMKGMKFENIHEMMWQRGVNLNETPGWQRKGIFVYRKKTEREGYNPLKGEKVLVERREIIEDWDPPVFASEKGAAFLKSVTGDL